MSMLTMRRRWLLAGMAAVTAFGAYALPAAQADDSPQTGSSQQSKAKSGEQKALEEVWRSDFDGDAGSLPSGDDWIIDKGHGYPGGPDNWGTGEIQEYTDSPENLQVDGEGHLKITAQKNGDKWTSGRIESKRTDFAAPEGGKMRIEASIQVPNTTGDEALGYWPAFWTLGDAYRGNYWNWPGIGEFDILENVNGINKAWGVLHCGVNPGGPCNETQGLGNSTECPETACQAGYHTYALELDRTGENEELRWYVDGKQFHTVSSADMDAQTWADATNHGHFILLNLAMGGAFPDGVAGHATPTDATKPGASMMVDYVAVSVDKGQGANSKNSKSTNSKEGSTK